MSSALKRLSALLLDIEREDVQSVVISVEERKGEEGSSTKGRASTASNARLLEEAIQRIRLQRTELVSLRSRSKAAQEYIHT